MDEPLQPTSATWAERASRWWYVLRYHRPSQLANRLLLRTRQRMARLLGTKPSAPRPQGPIGLREAVDFGALLKAKIAGRPTDESTTIAREVREGRFRFLRQSRSLPDPIDWQLEGAADLPRLWHFYLHYHEFLLDLAAEGIRTNEPAWFDRAWSLVGQWIDSHRPDDPRSFVDAWHPYCISRRLPVWCLLRAAAPPEDSIGETVLDSMATQAAYLRSHLERDIGGNHLMENAAALVVAGSMLAGPEADLCLETGDALLRAELCEQLLPHGEHFERAPMYHARMLEIVLDARDASRSVRPELARFCHEKAAEMAAFLQGILHPDGHVPLLGDSCFGQTPPPTHLLARAAQGNTPGNGDSASRRPNEQAEPNTADTWLGDYWTYRDQQDFLLLDAGPVGPDHLPAHAHADLLSVEASVAGQRLIVDSGVMGYEDDAMRRYCRSSSAHNVLQVDRHNQCDVWSRFRMGYRGRPSSRQSGQTNEFRWAQASHDAYRRLGVPRVDRWVACQPGGPWFCLDRAAGSGHHRLTGWLHLHPQVAVEQIADRRFRLQVDGQVRELQLLGLDEIVLDQGWYCPEFGRRTANPRICWTAKTSLPAACGWCLMPQRREGTVSLIEDSTTGVVLRWTEEGRDLDFHPFK